MQERAAREPGDLTARVEALRQSIPPRGAARGGTFAISRAFLLRYASTLVSAFRLDSLSLYVHRTVSSIGTLRIERQGETFAITQTAFETPAGTPPSPGLWRSNFGLANRRGTSPLIAIARRCDNFTQLERAYLELLAAEVSSVTAYELARRYETAFDEAMTRALRLIRDAKPAGTVISATTGAVAKTFGTRRCAYFSRYGAQQTPEYAARRTDPQKRSDVLHGDPVRLPAEFEAELSRGLPFVWHEAAAVADSLERAGARWVGPDETAPKSVLVIPANHPDCAGWWAVLLGTDEPSPPAGILEALKVPNEFAPTAVQIFHRRYAGMIVEPVYKGRDARVEEGKCAVLMPFTEPWSDRIYGRFLQTFIQEAGFSPVRADDLFGRDVMEDIWSMILTSEVVVADITGRNANVFYELGIAHTLGKPVILITQSTSDIPFDLNRYRHVIYTDDADGYDKLRAGLTGALVATARDKSTLAGPA